MNEALLIWAYLAVGELLNNLSTVFIIPVIFGFVVAIIVAPFWWDNKEDILEFFVKGTGKSWVKYYSIIVLTLIILGALYPSKDDLKYIIGGSLVWNGIEYASDIEGVDKLPENLVGSMNHFLESLQEEETE